MAQEKYLYCIIRCSAERTFPDVAPIGGEDGVAHTVPHGGLAVVVSDTTGDDLPHTRANLLAHERVQERVMQESTLLPVRFGTVTPGSSPMQDLQQLLLKRGQEFKTLLAEMDGKVELGLKALWRDEKAVFAEIVAAHPAIRRLRDSLRGKPEEALHFEGIPLGEMVKKALERKKRSEAAGLLASLRPIAYRTRENEVPLDRMILNAGFLVDQGRAAEFDRAVSTLEAKFGHRVSFKYVGPTPPYNFVNIVVNWEEIKE